MTFLAAMFPTTDPARHTDDPNACPVCRRDRAELISRVERLEAELREERSNAETRAWQAAAEWLRIRGQEAEAPNQKLVTDMAKDGRAAAMWDQLCADAMHSGLIRRLYAGKRPLPHDEYRTAKASGKL